MTYLNYDQMVDKALLSVVRQALMQVSKNGLLDDHHFYITFLTQYPGVEIPAYLAEQYPEEITIVLQHEFWNLVVEERTFSVDITFGDFPETIKIPFEALTHVSDPSASFELEFNPELSEITSLPLAPASQDKNKKKPSGKMGEVISLDQFRKK